MAVCHEFRLGSRPVGPFTLDTKTHLMKTLEYDQENVAQNRSIIDGLYNAFAVLRYDALHKNGNHYNAQVAHFWTLKDGKVVAFQQYVDTKKLSDAFAR
jgi:ketosteroid isomerase-like protein